MFCFNCGKEIPNGSGACPYCGAATGGGDAAAGARQAAERAAAPA
nr:zinc-ribbon domain-containing protein [Oscillospiraceae bacterium]